MNWYKQVTASGAVLTIIAILAGCSSPSASTIDSSSKLVMLSNLQTNTASNHTPIIEKDAIIRVQTTADLFQDSHTETIGLVNLPLVEGEDYAGYLGIWDTNGYPLQKIPLNGYNIMFPVKMVVNDLTQDNSPDIVLETDEHANGGNGIHDVYVYVQHDHSFINAPLPDAPAAKLDVTYEKVKKTFIIQSQKDHSRSWLVHLTPDITDFLDETVLHGTHPVNIDPVSEIEVTDNSLTTKRWLWFGKVQLNGLGFLVANYQYKNGTWVVKQYDIEPSGSD